MRSQCFRLKRLDTDFSVLRLYIVTPVKYSHFHLEQDKKFSQLQQSQLNNLCKDP